MLPFYRPKSYAIYLKFSNLK